LVLGLARVPPLGLFVVLSMPALSAGLLQAFRMIAAGQRPASASLFSPLVAGVKTGRLLLLGAVMVVVGIVAVSLMLSGSDSLLDPQLLARIEQGDKQALAELDPALLLRMMAAIAVGVSLTGTLSFMAIPLLWFRDWNLGTALISGIRALFVNWRPFSVLGLGLAVLLIPVALLVAVLFQVAAKAGFLSVLPVGLMLLIVLAFQLVVFGAQFCSFREIYGLDTVSPGVGAGGDKDDQLLA
ncbi:MAG: hypothetical protein ACREO9_03250, partial [Lysobacterales bacterium]